MIVFDLKCGGGHVFEAWFGASAAYEDQRAAGCVRCPLCDSDDIIKALMAPAIGGKGNRKPDAPTPDAIKSVMKRLAAWQADVLKSSEWVGTAFVERARAMHLGEENRRQSTARPVLQRPRRWSTTAFRSRRYRYRSRPPKSSIRPILHDHLVGFEPVRPRKAGAPGEI